MSNDQSVEDGAQRRRAPAMSPDDRRAAIVDAVIPLLRERGAEVSTRDMAQAAGVAEGTLFRVFADKDAIVGAAVERCLDPAPTEAALRRIDPALPTQDKVRAVVSVLRARFDGVFGLMAALHGRDGGHRAGGHGGPGGPGGPRGRGMDAARFASFVGIVDDLFAPGELAVPARTAAMFLRATTFATRMPGAGETLGVDDLVGLTCHGLLAQPAAGRTSEEAV